MAKVPKAIDLSKISKRISELNITPKVELEKLTAALKRYNPQGVHSIENIPQDFKASLQSFKRDVGRFHGARANLLWFQRNAVNSACSDKFGYMTSAGTRASSKLPFDNTSIALLEALGNMMGMPGRDNAAGDAQLPSGFTYFGQFVDHDITLDVSSSIDVETDATTINNMRSPSLDLDSLYGLGPALNPFLYEFPTGAIPSTAIKFKLGTNTAGLSGGPSTNGGGFGGMQIQTDFDLPRVTGSNTAVIGDPRNDENLFVSQFHMAMLKFHNAVIDFLIIDNFSGDLFVEVKKLVTQHYQWALVHDFLKRICGQVAVNNALLSVNAAIGSPFSMPVEFSVAAYRFGHSLIRPNYWNNHRETNLSLMQAFEFIRNPNLPVHSEKVVDFNAFFETGITVPIFNRARKIDSALTNGLANLPGFSGIMASLAIRNLRRGLALGLPSGQATALANGIVPLTIAQLKSGLPTDESNLLSSQGGLLLNKTPLWYYILREAAVLEGGQKLGPLGSKIVAETFIRMLKRNESSYLNVVGGFTPSLPSNVAGDFKVADLIIFSGANQP